MQPNAPSSIPSIPIPVQSPHATNEPHRHPRHQPPDPRPRVPTFGQLIAEPAFVLIDTAIVGHIGDTALAGLSIGSTILLTVVGLCVFLAYSTTSQVGHLIGAGRRREGLEAGIDGLWLALIIGSVASLVIFLAAEPLCWAMGARGDVLDNATAYLQAWCSGCPA